MQENESKRLFLNTMQLHRKTPIMH